MTNEHWRRFYSDRREVLFGVERVRVRVFVYFTTFTSHSFHILFLTDQMKGFVSIFQLLGRYVRRISVVFHRNFTRRDNQHVYGFPFINNLCACRYSAIS